MQSEIIPRNGVLLSVVMPAYNEEQSIESVIGEHVRVVSRLIPSGQWEIVCVDDASKDATYKILERLCNGNKNLRIVRHDRNKGIFEAFATSYREARGRYVYATGSDGQWPAEYMSRMFQIATDEADLVVAIRENRSEVYGWKRRLVSASFNLLPRLVLGTRVGDAGSVKLGLREIFAFSLISTSPFAEAERIVKANRLGYRVAFVPMRFRTRNGGKENGAKWKYVFASLRDLARCVRTYGIAALPFSRDKHRPAI